MNRGVQLFTYKNYCDESPLEKEILECGAGVFEPEMEPLFARFARDGYKVHGIDIAEERLAVLAQIAEEPAMHRRYSSCYAYEFFVVRRSLSTASHQ
jgi:2-polyprenyl-3-methyl-5-hydroxy-6-metoxy-1,4-benzoquinol methylase